MKLVLLVVFFITAYPYSTSNLASQWNSEDTTTSDNTTLTPYNGVFGIASTNVPAYSNGNDSYYSGEDYHLYGVFMGIKWQCVEYARRWLFIRKGCVFQSVRGAADIWNQVIHVQRVVDRKCFRMKTYPNGSPDPPKNESLIIYSRASPDMPAGHVVVIVDIVPGYVRVAEENFNFHYWSGNYARQIPVVVKNGNYYIEDVYRIDGWMSVEDNNQLKPLDESTISTIIKQNQSFPDFICSKSAILDSYSLYYLLFLCFILVRLASH